MPRVDVTLRGTPPVGVNATVLPASIARTVTIPTPSIVRGVTVTPSSVAGVAAVPLAIPVAPSRDDLVIEVDEPNAFNTGLLPGWIPTGVGANMATYSGPSTITTAGTTLQNLVVPVYLDIRAANVTIRNCYLMGPSTAPTSGKALVRADDNACTNLLIIDSEIHPQVTSRLVNGVQGHDFTAKRLKIHDVVDFFMVRDPSTPSALLNAVIEQCYCYDHTWFEDPGQSDNQTHNDAVQIQGGDGTGSRVRGNAFWGRTYSSRSSTSPAPPDRGTGTEDNGRYAQGALAGIQYTALGTLNSPSGYTRYSTDWDILGNWIRGYERGINAGSAVNTDVGRWHRNKFDDAQGERSGGSLSPGTGYTVTMDPTTTCDSGDGTANANVYLSGLSGITGGSEVTVRRNQ